MTIRSLCMYFDALCPSHCSKASTENSGKKKTIKFNNLAEDNGNFVQVISANLYIHLAFNINFQKEKKRTTA